MISAIAFFLLGASVGLTVTSILHRGHSKWSHQLHGRFRYANIPVGFAAMTLLASAFAVVGWTSFALALLAVGLGMGVSAVGFAWIDPYR